MLCRCFGWENVCWLFWALFLDVCFFELVLLRAILLQGCFTLSNYIKIKLWFIGFDFRWRKHKITYSSFFLCFLIESFIDLVDQLFEGLPVFEVESNSLFGWKHFSIFLEVFSQIYIGLAFEWSDWYSFVFGQGPKLIPVFVDFHFRDIFIFLFSWRRIISILLSFSGFFRGESFSFRHQL